MEKNHLAIVGRPTLCTPQRKRENRRRELPEEALHAASSLLNGLQEMTMEKVAHGDVQTFTQPVRLAVACRKRS